MIGVYLYHWTYTGPLVGVKRDKENTNNDWRVRQKEKGYGIHLFHVQKQ